MLNLIKADAKKILRSISFRIVPVAIVVMVAMLCGIFAGLKYIVESEELSAMLGASAESLSMLGAIASTGYDMTLMNLQSDTLIYILIIIFLSVSAFDFSAGTVKNLLSIGQSKDSIYFSKLVTTLVWGTLTVIFYVIVSTLFGYLVMQSTPTLEEIGNIAIIGLRQLPVYLTMLCCGHMLVFSMQRTVPSILIYIGSFMLFETVVPIIDMAIDSTVKVSWLMPLYQLIALTEIDVPLECILTVYISSAVYILSSIFGGYFKFKKSEIK